MNALPVFDKYKLIIVKNSLLFGKNSKSDTSKINELIKLLKEKPDYLLIVFISQELPYWSSRLFGYFKEIDAAYELDGCDIKDEFIKKWIIKKACDLNFNLNMKSAEYFLSHIGYYDGDVNAEVLYNELNKLSCFCADKKTADEDDIKKNMHILHA
jgi:DNA polymerase III delta subunit